MSINSLLTNQPVLNTLKQIIGGGGGATYTSTLPIEISGLNDISLLEGKFLTTNGLTGALDLNVSNAGAKGQILQYDTVNQLTFATLPASGILGVDAGTNIAVDNTNPDIPLVSMPIAGTAVAGNYVGSDNLGALTWETLIFPKIVSASSSTEEILGGQPAKYIGVTFTPTVTGFAYASAFTNYLVPGESVATGSASAQIYNGVNPIDQTSTGLSSGGNYFNLSVGASVPTVAGVSMTVSVYVFGDVKIENGYINVIYDTPLVATFVDPVNFEFFPTAENNTATIYADGAQGVNVPGGGWQYTNDITGKINWYCYSSPDPLLDYKVGQLKNVYAVINQQSVLGLATAQNPFIIVYTRPTPSSTTWYNNKYFWGSNALTDTTGVRLLYTGEDPVDVHPEIVAPNRIQLEFKPLLSTATPFLSQDDDVWLGSLQTTNNTSPAGSFNFTLQEFGINWSS